MQCNLLSVRPKTRGGMFFSRREKRNTLKDKWKSRKDLPSKMKLYWLIGRYQKGLFTHSSVKGLSRTLASADLLYASVEVPRVWIASL